MRRLLKYLPKAGFDNNLKARNVADGNLWLPSALIDFRKNRYFLTPVPAAGIASAALGDLAQLSIAQYSDAFAFTRASTATYIDVNGVMQTAAINEQRFDYSSGVRQALVEGGTNNVLANRLVGATESVTTTAQSYTLSFYGTGSYTLSGTATGTLNGTGANNRVTLTVTATAGTLTLTVTGSCTNVQLEALPFTSSFVNGTRAADTPRLSPKLEALIQRASCTVVVKGEKIFGLPYFVLLGGGTAQRLLGSNGGGTAIGFGASPPNSVPTGSITQPVPSFGTAGSWDAGNLSLSYNSGTVSTTAFTMATDRSQVYLGRDSVANPAYGWINQFIIYPFRTTDAEVQRLAAAYA